MTIKGFEEYMIKYVNVCNIVTADYKMSIKLILFVLTRLLGLFLLFEGAEKLHPIERIKQGIGNGLVFVVL